MNATEARAWMLHNAEYALVETPEGFIVSESYPTPGRDTGVVRTGQAGQSYLSRQAEALNAHSGPDLTEAAWWSMLAEVTASGAKAVTYLDRVQTALHAGGYAVVLFFGYQPNQSFPTSLKVVGRGFTARIWFATWMPVDVYHSSEVRSTWNGGGERVVAPRC